MLQPSLLHTLHKWRFVSWDLVSAIISLGSTKSIGSWLLTPYSFRYKVTMDCLCLMHLLIRFSTCIHTLCSGFLNMFVFSRPKWLRLREAGIPTGKALRAACLEPDVGNYIEQSIRVASSRAPDSAKHNLQSKASMPNSIMSSPGLESIDESPLETEETRMLSGEDTANFSSETSS